MKIAAITKFKHGMIYEASIRLGWTMIELSRRTGISYRKINLICNLHKRPTPSEADQIALAFGEAGQWIDVLEGWPEGFEGIPKGGGTVVQVKEVELLSLCGNREALQIPAHISPDTTEIDSALEQSISTLLTDKEALAIRLRYWENRTFDEIGHVMGFSTKWSKQIFHEAIGKLRKHRSWKPNSLEPFMTDHEDLMTG